jgi:septum formation protein
VNDGDSRASIVLASRSPRRREILTAMGVAFDVDAANVDESPLANESPRAMVERLARDKVAQVAARHPGRIVLGADTTIDLDGRSLGTPANVAEARATLRALSGRTHFVHTAVVAARDAQVEARVETAVVEFVPLDDVTLEEYLATGESLDVAGAYAIQGRAAHLASLRRGSFSTVVGLPVHAVADVLTRLGLSVAGPGA